MGMIRAFGATYAQAARESWAGGTGAFLPLGYMFGAIALIPLTISADGKTLALFAPGLIWFVLALSALVTLERLFQSDLEDGTLDALRLGPLPMEAVALAKVCALWTVSALPIICAIPLAAIMLGLGADFAVRALPLYGLGSLAFYAWGGVGAALAASVRRGGLLIALVVLPLYAPAIIFGSSVAAGLAETGQYVASSFLFLAANTLLALAAGPIAMALGLKTDG